MSIYKMGLFWSVGNNLGASPSWYHQWWVLIC